MTTSKDATRDKVIKLAVVEQYSEVAKGASCCGPAPAKEHASSLYTEDQLGEVPDAAAVASAGCGNPVALASLRKGETVVDLGSGGGTDIFLAAKAVGPTGRAIGIDMTPDMIALARENAEKVGLDTVEFRLGEIEVLPLGSNSVDVIISNCVINLAPDKDAVFREAYRVLKPGGRLMVSDIMSVGDLSDEMKADPKVWASCVAGAISVGDYTGKMKGAGFDDIEVQGGEPKPDVEGWRKSMASAYVSAVKPVPRCCG